MMRSFACGTSHLHLFAWTLALNATIYSFGFAAEPTVPDATKKDSYTSIALPFLKTHCIECHGPDEQSGDLRFDDLTADAGKDVSRWTAIRDQLRDGLMPPADEPRPDASEVRKLVAKLTLRLGSAPSRLPNQGNLIPHELLFGEPDSREAASPPRIWRISPDAYQSSIKPLYKENIQGIVNPFVFGGERGFKDFANLHTVDEAVTEVLLRNATIIVDHQTMHEVKDGKYQATGHGSHREYVELIDPAIKPTREQLENVLQMQFDKAVHRSASPEEVSRYLELYEKCAQSGDSPAAFKTMLQAVILRPDAIYRYEMGLGSEASANRRMLSPAELEQAVSLSVGNQRDPRLVPTLTEAYAKGEPALKEVIAARVQSTFDDPKGDKARAMGFFREYLEHTRAPTIFKNDQPDLLHEPNWLVSDTDHLIRFILTEDRDVFRQLLTTRRSFVNFNLVENKQTRAHDIQARGVVPHEINHRGKLGVESVYGLKEWPSPQPIELPEGTRIGVLMQPSWLVAWSTNFENDPVRRGRWIRERLLGGTVPDLPIGVAAMVPEAPHRTFRDRLTVTRDANCWKCHQKMDELGLPFEEFDHLGRVKSAEQVEDPEATAKHVDKDGKSLGPVTRELPLNMTGTIADTGDPNLDGPVKDARELVRKIANSDRARQVFIRHVFRYYLGRNESLSDARALQDADRAYVASGGSFKALLTSLLTSDPFLYRVATAAPGGSP